VSGDDQFPDDFERSAGGLDYDEVPIRDRASQFGHSLASDGADVLFEEIENLLPESWKEQIVQFPITAVLLGVAAGLFLGMKKGDELIAAGSAAIGAAATANLSRVLSQR
jgi:hypothetical protein